MEMKQSCGLVRPLDPVRFEAARTAILGRDLRQGGIGTLGEKSLHAIVKHYLEADPSRHEQKLGSFVVDIFDGERIYEIQTRQFGKLSAKLRTFLPDYPITVVYPMPARKWLLWIDPDSGELSRPRLSPKRGRTCEIFRELYRIKPFLSHPNLSVLILQMDLEEYRLLNGWSDDRKRGSRRENRLPLSLEKELLVGGPREYGQLLPDSLPSVFTSADLARCAQISSRLAQVALNVLISLGQVTVCSKRGRFRQYMTRDLSEPVKP